MRLTITFWLTRPHALRLPRQRLGCDSMCTAYRVLPQPPAPVRVSRWVLGHGAVISARSRSRPTVEDNWAGRVTAANFDERPDMVGLAVSKG